MPLPDNNPEKWELEEHTKVKHQLLEKYLRAWISVVGSFRDTLGYFDCFAGRGEYNDGSIGSPVIVMKAAQELIDKVGKVKKFLCTFIENNPENYESLKNVVSRAQKTCKDVECHTYNRDFQEVITDYLDYYEDKTMVPCLYFIDPFGWSGVPFHVVKRILEHRYSEIIFVFMTYEIARFCSSKMHENSLNELFGNDQWKMAQQYSGEKRHDALVQIYEQLLENETDAEYVWSFRVNDSEMRKRTKYYIIHASHDIKGLRVMKPIMRKQGSGIFEYLGPEDDVLRTQTRFETFNLEHFLLEYFSGRTISFDDLCNELYPISRHPVSKYIDSDYRNSLKKMEKNRAITINRIYSKKTGLNKTDSLIFP
jgi:three-Cys-motif partner protein